MNSKAKQVSLWERIKKQKLLLLMTVPGLVLTFIFKYIPMYGVLIAFKDYNPLKGILGSDWIGFSEFTKFISSPNFGILLANTLKLSIYGLLLGFLPPIILAIMLNQLLSEKSQKTNSAHFIRTKLYLSRCYCRYDFPLLFSGRTNQQFSFYVWNEG